MSTVFGGVSFLSVAKIQRRGHIIKPVRKKEIE